ncbi:MAG: hypothetical protein Ct9H90mP13_09580 [Pseudomonadota bacterium]|nr:MAG: hypothetical protein Ct9H90mP13_09580 [Pseudomonadota bacterium]
MKKDSLMRVLKERKVMASLCMRIMLSFIQNERVFLKGKFSEVTGVLKVTH